MGPNYTKLYLFYARVTFKHAKVISTPQNVLWIFKMYFSLQSQYNVSYLWLRTLGYFHGNV